MPDVQVVSTPIRLGLYLQFEPEAVITYTWSTVGESGYDDVTGKLKKDLAVCICTINRDAYGLPEIVGMKPAVNNRGEAVTLATDGAKEKIKTGSCARALKQLGLPTIPHELKIWIDVALALAGVGESPAASAPASVQNAPRPAVGPSTAQPAGEAPTSSEWNGRENINKLLLGVENADRAIIQKKAKALGFVGNMMQPREEEFHLLVQAHGQWRDEAPAEEEPF